MNAVTIIAIISLCVLMIGMFVGTMFSLLMIEELDRRKHDGWADSASIFRRRPTIQDFREYRSSYPDGKLHKYTLVGYAIAMVGFIGILVSMVSGYQPLVVRITSPAKDSSFAAPANILISAEASEGSRNISRVDFYQGTTLIGSSTTPPYSVIWNTVPTGRFYLTVKAIDERGTTEESDAVSIEVYAPRKAAP